MKTNPKAAEFMMVLLHAATIAHIIHLQTNSFAQHMALDELYQALPDLADELIEDEIPVGEDPGAERRFRFRHPTASGKTIAAAGFVEAARSQGVLILTHRRLLVDQFKREGSERGRNATTLIPKARARLATSRPMSPTTSATT